MVQKTSEPSVKKSSMTPATLKVLTTIEQCVSANPGIITMAIAAQLGIKKTTLCQHLNRLADLKRMRKTKYWDRDLGAFVCGWNSTGVAALPAPMDDDAPRVLIHDAIQTGMQRMDIVAALFGSGPGRGAACR